SFLVSNEIAENIKIYSDKLNTVNILLTDYYNGFVHYIYDHNKNTITKDNLTAGRNYRGISIDANSNIICSVSKQGIVYIYDWKGGLISTISNSLSRANCVSLTGDIMFVGDRISG